MLKQQILNDIRNMSKDGLEELYGLEILDNNKVNDIAENRQFKNLSEWAAFVIEQETCDRGGRQVSSKKYGFDDDF